MSETLTSRQLVYATCLAGIWGSLAGTLLFVLYFGSFLLVFLSPLIFAISAAATVPVAVVAGVVTLWPVRKWISRTPLLAAVPASIVGWLSYLGFSRLLMGHADRGDSWIIVLFSATTAISLVVCVWWTKCRSSEDQSEEMKAGAGE